MILESKKIKSVIASTFPSYICQEMIRPDARILVFWKLSFKPVFSQFSFTLIKRLLNSYLLSAFRVASSACLRLLIFLLTILIPACASFSLAFCMMFHAYKLINRVTIYALDGLLFQFGTRYVLITYFVVIFKCSSFKKKISQHNFHKILGLKICGREILGDCGDNILDQEGISP